MLIIVENNSDLKRIEETKKSKNKNCKKTTVWIANNIKRTASVGYIVTELKPLIT